MSRKDMEIFKSLAMVSQLGIAILVPLIGFVILGNYLGQRFQRPLLFLLSGIILGLYIGFRNVYSLVLRGTKQIDGKKKP